MVMVCLVVKVVVIIESISMLLGLFERFMVMVIGVSASAVLDDRGVVGCGED